MRIDSHATDPDLLDAALRWARESYPLGRHRHVATAEGDDAERTLWRETQALGWPAVRLPVEQGGLDASLAQACALADAKGYSLLALPWVEHAVLAVGLLRHAGAGTAGPRDNGRLHAADTRWACALREPGERLDSAPPSACVAHRDGHAWVIRGRKASAPGIGQADGLLVTARIDGGSARVAADEGELGLFVAWRADAAGQTVAGLRVVADACGLDGHRRAALDLDGVRLEPGALLLRGRAAARAIEQAVDDACLAWCAEACALARRALHDTLAHLAVRVQFGRRIGEFQALRHRVADMAVATEYASAMTWGAIAARDQAGTQPGGDDVRRADVSCARVEALRDARFVAEQAVQLHGALGVCDEVAVSHVFKRVVALDAMLGDRAWHLERVAAARVLAC